MCRWVRASAPAGVAPEPLGGSGRTGWGVFCVVSVGARERTRGCSPRAVRVEPAGGVILAGVCVCLVLRCFV